MYKKLISLFLALAFILSAGSALADGPSHATTQSFLDFMDSEGIVYNWRGTDSDGYDLLTVSYEGDNKDTIRTSWGFSSTKIDISVWDLITYKQSDYYNVLEACNALNKQYSYVRFVVDTSDNTVYADCQIRPMDDDVGAICRKMLSLVVQIVDLAYPTLEPYNK